MSCINFSTEEKKSKILFLRVVNIFKYNVKYNLDHPNTLVIRNTESVRITEIIIKSMKGDFHLILQKVLFSFDKSLRYYINDENHHCNLKGFPRKLGHFYDDFHP